MTSLIVGIGTILLTIALTIAGLLVFRKLVDPADLKIDHEVTTALIAVMGTLYAIVLGLVVVDALQHREQAEMMESTEANALATVMHLCRTLPEAERRNIMLSERDYCELALGKEWDLMDKGTAPEHDTMHAFNELWEKVSAYDPHTNRETNLHTCMLSAMTDLSNSRRFRIVTCKHGLPFLLWVILIVGGICTIGFTYFFSAEKPKLQMVMTSIVAFMLCLNVLLVFFYSSPYKGDMRIQPTAMLHVRDSLRKSHVLQNIPTPEDNSGKSNSSK